jgi:PAS domain S-box-containing protein
MELEQKSSKELIEIIKQLENKNAGLRKEITIYKQIWDKSFDGMRLVDKDGSILLVNNALCWMLEKSKNELEGEDYTVCYAPERREEMMERQKNRFSMHTFEPQFDKLQTLWNGKKVWFELSNSFIDLNDNEQLLLSIFRDISVSKDAEKKLKELISSKDKFFSIIAHDLKSPFQGLLGFSDILSEDFDTLSNEEIKSFIGNIAQSARNLFNLLQNLLEWSRLQTDRIDYNPAQLDLYEEVSSVLELVSGNAVNKKIALINEVAKKTFVFADDNMLRSICQNLVSNAIKFTRPGGEIKITASEGKNNFIRIAVADNGVGIREGDLDKLFRIDVTHTTKGTANETGTGLGLIIIKEMVERHGGEIWVNSVYGQGSEFVFTLPKQKS